MPQPNAWWLGAFQGRELKKFCNIIFVIKYFYKLVSIILFCHQCEKVFFSAFDPFWCETIYLSGQLKMSWKTMLLQMVCVQGQKYSCKLCSKDYSALMGLNIHKRNVHGIITWIKKIQQILKNSSDVRDIKKRNHEFSNSQNQSSAKRPESLLKPLSNGVLFLKGHSLYQISSKMLHGLKVFTFMLWHLKKYYFIMKVSMV